MTIQFQDCLLTPCSRVAVTSNSVLTDAIIPRDRIHKYLSHLLECKTFRITKQIIFFVKSKMYALRYCLNNFFFICYQLRIVPLLYQRIEYRIEVLTA